MFIPYEIILISFYAVFSFLNSFCKYAKLVASDAVSMQKSTLALNNSIQSTNSVVFNSLIQ